MNGVIGIPELAPGTSWEKGNNVGNKSATNAKVTIPRLLYLLRAKNITTRESRRRSREPRKKWEVPERMVKLRYSRNAGCVDWGPVAGAFGPGPINEITSSAETTIRKVAKTKSLLESSFPSIEPPNIAKPRTSRLLKG